MKTVFLTQEGMPHEATRSNAFGYKRLLIDEAVQMCSPVEITTDENDESVLHIVPAVDNLSDEGEEDDVYVCLCKEFGVVGYKNNERSKISVLFCDGGWMLVTLMKGGILLNLNGEIMMPTVGEFNSVASSESEIMWVNSEYLKGYRKYWGTKGMFIEDVEWCFEVCGERVKNNNTFAIQHISGEDVDLSFGYIAQYEAQEQAKAEAKQAQEVMRMFQQTGTDSEYMFEDEQDFEDEEEYDDTDDDIY